MSALALVNSIDTALEQYHEATARYGVVCDHVCTCLAADRMPSAAQLQAVRDAKAAVAAARRLYAEERANALVNIDRPFA